MAVSSAFATALFYCWRRRAAPAASLPPRTGRLVPMLIIFIVAQRYFVRSVAATGLAGT